MQDKFVPPHPIGGMASPSSNRVKVTRLNFFVNGTQFCATTTTYTMIWQEILVKWITWSAINLPSDGSTALGRVFHSILMASVFRSWKRGSNEDTDSFSKIPGKFFVIAVWDCFGLLGLGMKDTEIKIWLKIKIDPTLISSLIDMHSLLWFPDFALRRNADDKNKPLKW